MWFTLYYKNNNWIFVLSNYTIKIKKIMLRIIMYVCVDSLRDTSDINTVVYNEKGNLLRNKDIIM